MLRNPLRAVRYWRSVVLPLVRTTLDDAWAAAAGVDGRGADVVIHHPKLLGGGPEIASGWRVPGGGRHAACRSWCLRELPGPGRRDNGRCGPLLNRASYAPVRLAAGLFAGELRRWRADRAHRASELRRRPARRAGARAPRSPCSTRTASIWCPVPMTGPSGRTSPAMAARRRRCATARRPPARLSRGRRPRRSTSASAAWGCRAHAPRCPSCSTPWSAPASVPSSRWATITRPTAGAGGGRAVGGRFAGGAARPVGRIRPRASRARRLARVALRALFGGRAPRRCRYDHGRPPGGPPVGGLPGVRRPRLLGSRVEALGAGPAPLPQRTLAAPPLAAAIHAAVHARHLAANARRSANACAPSRGCAPLSRRCDRSSGQDVAT
jgi:hypothetical protein